MSTSFKTSIQVRFGDTDMLGHVNNVAFVQFLEQSRVEWMHHLMRQGLPRFDVVVVHLTMDYRQQIHFGQHVEVEVWPTKLGNTSFDFSYRMWADGVLCAEARSVQVGIDPQTMRPKPLPLEIRAALEATLDFNSESAFESESK
jgi:acyl-CoA thioester hydrolase